MSLPIEHFIDRGSALQALQTHARRLVRLQALVAAELPEPLATHCHVANLRDGALVLHVEGGGVAAKLRQILPSLLERMRAHEPALSSLRIRVRPPAPPAARPAILREVPLAARAQLEALAGSLPADSPVRLALGRLVRRAG